MKTGFATALSVAGVLAAGAAAFAVNNSVLGATKADTATAPSVSVTPVDLTTPSSTVAPSAKVDANATQVGSTTTTYTVGGAGSVVIDTSSGAIQVVGIAPNSGYTSEPAMTDPSGAVKVHFVSSTQRIEFIARLVDGGVKVEVRNEGMVANPPSSGAPTPRHHDDDGSEHDGEHVFGGDDD